jgi:hypothetical protein
MRTQPELYTKLPLVHHSLRYAGYLLIFLSLAAAYLYHWGGRPAFFEVPVFAILTSYAETRWFVLAQTNSLDEIAVLSAFLGLLFILFAEEKNENPQVQIMRIRSLFLSVYITAMLMIIIYITVYGWPVFILISFSFIIFLVISIVIFKVYLYRHKRVEKSL